MYVDLLSRIVGNVYKGVRLKLFLVTWLYFIGVASIGQWPCYEKIWNLHMHAFKKANKHSAYAVWSVLLLVFAYTYRIVYAE